MSLTAWSRTYDQGLIGISGGLDSSIVAASLRKAGNTLSGLTLMTDDPLGDERAFATAVASHIGMPLFEEDYDLANIDLDRSSRSEERRVGKECFSTVSSRGSPFH